MDAERLKLESSSVQQFLQSGSCNLLPFDLREFVSEQAVSAILL